jgi:demethylmenaquinone methyltransferase/2-methoxy-6-polyprenyl-1,4-benzoquinol methylase
LTPRLYDLFLERIVRSYRVAGLEAAPPRPGLRVLDVGCGTGSHLALYQAGGAEVTGVDRSPPMLARAAEKLGSGATLIEGDATELPLPDERFDLSIAMTLLHELAPDERMAVLGEMRRVTTPDGRLLVIDHDPGRPAGFGPRLARTFATGIERIAGGDHYRNYRRFRALGGLPGLAGRAGLTVEQHRREGAGVIGIYLIR